MRKRWGCKLEWRTHEPCVHTNGRGDLERDFSGVGAVGVDEVEGEAVYYDLMGRVVERPVKGVFVVKDGKGTRKVIL